ncbi:molybdopterin-guanine dinucleotide biosynthesis protein B [Paenibacillus nasutitermitis]|uniref:Molybdopterin-guanine dinucleotide biosynthesis protein B (MobB) domain-containing protein n=1 Tax=Paenibacillus nasutitermitis TaxID=1652958 RepID=A0A916ZJZ8_9BACL|nr:molybdopterin-guanine dinucleotide biosynthesis protein B [Paenibacillus nasutitermitis]GGE01573.1 hypothetical protein GCM10010911_70600 [Paenibacillus nasutitermitis]
MMTANDNLSTTTTAPFVLQIVGYKNSGKTTLITALIPRFKELGFRVGTIKHDAHDFSIDRPGTDSWKHQQAGADITAISSPWRTAVMSNSPEPLSRLLAGMEHVDLVLVEGFKHESHRKLVLLREAGDLPLLSELNFVAGAAWWPAASPAPDGDEPMWLAEPADANPLTDGEARQLADNLKHFRLHDTAGIFLWIHSLLVTQRQNGH